MLLYRFQDDVLDLLEIPWHPRSPHAPKGRTAKVNVLCDVAPSTWHGPLRMPANRAESSLFADQDSVCTGNSCSKDKNLAPAEKSIASTSSRDVSPVRSAAPKSGT